MAMAPVSPGVSRNIIYSYILALDTLLDMPKGSNSQKVAFQDAHQMVVPPCLPRRDQALGM